MQQVQVAGADVKCMIQDRGEARKKEMRGCENIRPGDFDAADLW